MFSVTISLERDYHAGFRQYQFSTCPTFTNIRHIQVYLVVPQEQSKFVLVFAGYHYPRLYDFWQQGLFAMKYMVRLCTGSKIYGL